MVKKPITILSIIIGIFLLSSFATALTSLGTFEKDEEVKIVQGCGSCTSVNISSIRSPNSTLIVSDIEMDEFGDEFRYNLSSNYTNQLGEYRIIQTLNPDGTQETVAYKFKITNSGQDFTAGQGIGSAAVLLATMAVSFFFMILGFRMSGEQKLVPVSFLLVSISVLLMLSSMFISYSLSQDIAQYSAISDLSQTLFVSLIYLVSAIGIVFIAIMLISFIKELGKMSEKKKFGDNWDPITKTYSD